MPFVRVSSSTLICGRSTARAGGARSAAAARAAVAANEVVFVDLIRAPPEAYQPPSPARKAAGPPGGRDLTAAGPRPYACRRLGERPVANELRRARAAHPAPGRRAAAHRREGLPSRRR